MFFGGKASIPRPHRIVYLDSAVQKGFVGIWSPRVSANIVKRAVIRDKNMSIVIVLGKSVNSITGLLESVSTLATLSSTLRGK